VEKQANAEETQELQRPVLDFAPAALGALQGKEQCGDQNAASEMECETRDPRPSSEPLRRAD
jgi:hypothetical protein